MDLPLTDLGRRQAEALAERLEGREISVLYSSDLTRALETARIVGKRLGLTPIPDPRLREVDLGGWSGLTRAQVIARYPEEWERWGRGEDIDHAGGESFAQFWERVSDFIEEILRRHPGETVLAVTHGGVSRMLAGVLLGLDLREMFTDLPPLVNTGITEALFCNDEAELLSWMDGSHLEKASLKGVTTTWHRKGPRANPEGS
jgi:broad specificity phosphatase PhoE